MISLNGVSKSYDGKKKAVDDVTLEIKPGEIFGFLGPNGAGKTTAIKLITGILPPDEGEIAIGKTDIAQNPIKAKQMIGFVSDDPNVYLRLRGIEYLTFIADIYGVQEELRAARIEFLAKALEMTAALSDKLQSYSHGMRQKIAIMGALLHNPPVWILDEPMTGLDPKAASVLKGMMRTHAKAGKTVFFSTHVLEVAEKLCDRLAIIKRGKIVFCGTLEELKQQRAAGGSLEDMFLEITSKRSEP